MVYILFVIVIIVLFIGGFIIIKNFLNNKKEEGFSWILFTTGIELIISSFNDLEDKVLPALAILFKNLDAIQTIKIIDNVSRTNNTQLIIGIFLLCLGLLLRFYIKNRIYILNINAYFDKRIETNYKDLNLSTFEFKERIIDFIRIFKSGINEKSAKFILAEIEEKVKYFLNETKDVKRGYTGIAPIPFLVLAGTMFKREKINEYYEYDKKDTEKYYKLTNLHFFEKYPDLQLLSPLENIDKSVNEVVISISTTSSINDSDLSQFNGKPIIKLAIDKPKDNVIKFKKQLRQYVGKVYETINDIKDEFSSLKKIHLIYAGQGCLAFEIGKLIDDNRMPKIISYHYSIQTELRYPWGLIVNGPEKNIFIQFSNNNGGNGNV